MYVLIYCFSVFAETFSHLLPRPGPLYDEAVQEELAGHPAKDSRGDRKEVRPPQAIPYRQGQIREGEDALPADDLQGQALLRTVGLDVRGTDCTRRADEVTWRYN